MKLSKSKSLGTVLVLAAAVFLAVNIAGAAEPGPPPPAGGGAPPSGQGQPAVKKDNTPIPESGIVSITFLGNTKFSSEQLLEVIDGSGVELGAKPGPDIIGPAMTKLVEFYRKNGADLSASPNIIEDPKGITFVQFLIDENGTGGDIGGLVSSGGVHIFYK